MSFTEPIRDRNDMRKLIAYFVDKGQTRNAALVVVGFATAMRISDELSLTWGDVYDFDRERFLEHIRLKERKTGKSRQAKLNQYVKEALRKLLNEAFAKGKVTPDGYIFTNGRKDGNHLTRVQAWRLIKNAARALAIEGTIACHSLRKTFGYFSWKYFETKLPVIMEIYNHSSLAVTMRYLGITQEDHDRAYDAMVL